MASVTLRNLRKSYGQTVVVKQVDLKIEDRELCVLLGPSGCGKSTILRMIAGLESVTDGEILIGQTVVNRLDPGERDIAMVFQNYALYPHMTVKQNMGFCLENLRLPRAEITRRVFETARILKLEQLLHRLPAELSGGQRQRVAIGRALVRQPRVFLMDEPLSNLDAKLRGRMRVEIAHLHQTLQITTVYVTHDQVEAMTLADRIVILDGGVIQQIGRPLEVYRRPSNRFVAGFIGSPPMSFVRAELVQSDDAWHLDAPGVRVPLDGALAHRLQGATRRYVVVGLRPQELRLAPQGEGLFSGRVTVIEPYGAETYITLDLGAEEISARLDPEASPARGETCSLTTELDRLFFFDPDTGAAI